VIGKWAYLSLSADRLNFEEVLVGQSVTKELTIKNHSLVAARFTIDRVPED
jgi:hypothetical protein